MKKKGMGNASKWFLCFRPPPTIDIDAGVDCTTGRMLSLIAAARKNKDLKKDKKMKKQKSVKSKTPISSTTTDHDPPPTGGFRRSFSGVFRAVLFETSHKRKVREAKLRNCPVGSATVQSSDHDSNATADQTQIEKQSATVADREADSKQDKCSYSLPASDSCSNPAEEETKQGEIRCGRVRINPVVCLVLISLWVTVFWGRLCAVMTTTVWIYAWQSGAVLVGLALGLRKTKKKSVTGIQGSEKVIPSFCKDGNNLIEPELCGN